MPRPPSGTGLALCHEWLGARHGSEKTFEAMAGVFPDADLYALTWNRSAGLHFDGREVSTTFIDRIGPLRDRRMLQLPVMPLAWRYATRRRYDVVVTSSHACAKGFWPARRALHLCYCYTPMRYLWLPTVDVRRPGRRASAAIAARPLRSWDRKSARSVDRFAAISTTVARRIEEVYGRTSQVIPPPVDTRFFTPSAEPRRGFAVAVARMVPYKRLDLAIRACHRAGHPLVVAGAGPDEATLRALAAQLRADVRFVIAPSDTQLRDLYRAADVLVFPAEEDFGIVPVEAQACGTPVVAFGRGGATDTVVPAVTGELVAQQDEEAFAAGIEAGLHGRYDVDDCRTSAERFSAERFAEAFARWVIGAAAERGIRVGDPRAREHA